ncbi:MAG: hypothetical protein IKW36_07385 [Alistipes sp.]|nr:hypothetical protein [Alistipes sp.]
MRKFLALAALVLGLASCQNEPEGLNVVTGGEIDTVVTVAIPEAETRSSADSAVGAFKDGVCTEGVMRYILQVYYNGETTDQNRQVMYSNGTTVSFPVRLVPNRNYQFVVWADVVDAEEEDSKYYETGNLKNITLKDNSWNAMDEKRDAFTATETINFNGSLSINIPLYRPFAKLRVVATDYDELANQPGGAVVPHHATVKYYTKHRVAFNAYAGTAMEAEAENIEHHQYEIKTYANENTLTGDHTIFADYFFAENSAENNDVVRFEIEVFEQNGQLIKKNEFTTDIPVKANYLTTLKGDVLTEGNDITVEVEDPFQNGSEWNPGNDDYDVEVWDGVTITEPAYDATNKTYTVKNGAELAWIAQEVNNGTTKFEGKTVILAKNINLGGHEWTPIGGANYFGGTFNGNNKTVGDFKVTTKEGHAGLFGNARGIIKDLTVVNVTIVANHYAGAIVGQGYVKMNNCHANNIDITLSSKNEDGDKAGGLVGQNCEGANMYITNSTAKNVKIQGYRDLGGIAGMAHYDGKVTDCSVENITIYQDLSDNYESTTPTTLAGVVGRVHANIGEYARNYESNVYIGVIIAEGLTQETESGDYNVSSAEGLAYIAEQVNVEGNTEIASGDIILNGDIDLASISTFATRGNASNWTPIGTSEKPFTGTFDGNGCTIKNLVIDGGSNSNIGFFGFTTNGEIKNVTFENAEVSGRLNVGVVAGTPYTSKYTNITVKGHVEVNGMAYVGAVGGKNAYADWTNITVEVDETSYVNANSVENGTAYRTYVGGVCGFNGEGGHSFKNITSNINVKGSTCDVGGLFGIAHYGNKFENCVCTGDVEIYAASEEADAQEIGGIAGVWHPGGADVVMTNCSFDGELKANNDYKIHTYKFGALVCAAYNNTGKGKLIIDGKTYLASENNKVVVSTADELVEALENNLSVKFANDIKIEPASMSNAYGTTGINVKYGQTIDGNGYTLNIKGAGGTWDSGINTTGGLIKNLTVTGSFRGIFINHTSDHSEKVVLENVTVGGNGTVYTISCDQGKYQTIEATNCTFNGWTSFAKTAGEAKFVNCNFGEGSGYKYCRPYSNTEFVGCTFCPGYAVDTTRATITFTDCTWEE